MTSSTDPRLLPRFRGRPAGPRTLHLTAGFFVTVIAACGVAGIVGAITALAFFAVGAGAGYSLSGSV